MTIRKLTAAFFFLSILVSSNSHGAPNSPAWDANGSFSVTWDSGYTDVEIFVSKNGIQQYTVFASSGATSRNFSGLGEGVWNFFLRGRPVGGGGGGYPDYFAIVDKIKNNPLFFIVSSAHAQSDSIIGSTQTEVLYIPGAPQPISLASTDKDGSYSISWGSASGSFDRYELQERKDGGAWQRVHNGIGRSKSVSGKLTGVYEYRVRTCNDSAHTSRVKCSADSTLKCIPIMQPAPPNNFALNLTAFQSLKFFLVDYLDRISLRQPPPVLFS